MTRVVYALLLGSVLAWQGVASNAQEANTAGYDAVQAALAAGKSPEDTISTLRVSPFSMSLAEATVFAMVAGGEQNRVAMAEAGIGLADNLAQAQSVATAVKAAAGQSGPVADAVDRAMEDFARYMDQPSVYEDDYEPRGSGVSPAS